MRVRLDATAVVGLSPGERVCICCGEDALELPLLFEGLREEGGSFEAEAARAISMPADVTRCGDIDVAPVGLKLNP